MVCFLKIKLDVEFIIFLLDLFMSIIAIYSNLFNNILIQVVTPFSICKECSENGTVLCVYDCIVQSDRRLGSRQNLFYSLGLQCRVQNKLNHLCTLFLLFTF